MQKRYKIFDKEYEFEENQGGEVPDLSVPFSPQYVRVITMCLHISYNCNLACKYCFKKIDGELSLNDVKRFIDIVTQVYPNADRYIVDMSGAGEPLLHKEFALNIAKYCNELSDKYLREFLPTFVTNGVLLTPETVSELQSAGILFGISLDGTKENHDKNRIFANGKGSYDIVVNNIRRIQHNDYVGLAMTYSDGNLLESFMNMSRLLPTISMKPVRYTEKPLNAEEVCNGYDELIKFVLDKTIVGEKNYVYSLVNGDDYFGKFLKRTLLKHEMYGRCDAGIGRFSLAGDKNIYFCPAAAGMEGGIVGNLEYGIRLRKIYEMWDEQRNSACVKCFARKYCGGECKIVSYNKYGHFNGLDPIMCKIKRHLFLLANYFTEALNEKAPDMHKWLLDSVRKMEDYYKRDEQLITAATFYKDKTYTELKRIKDTTPEEFEKLLKKIN